MSERWILTPQYFETLQPGLSAAASANATINGPHQFSARDNVGMGKLHRPIAGFVAQHCADGNRPVSMAGDCCAAVAVLAGMQRAGLDPWFVWVDAHGDFNTPETSPSQFLGGMPLAMAVGRGPQWMCETVGLSPITEDRVILVDGRDLDPLEAEAIDGSGIRHIRSVAGLGSIKLSGPVLLHVDLDVIDGNEAPAFNYPAPEGPTSQEVARALSTFARGNDIAAVSFSGWDATSDRDGRTAKACKTVVQALTVL